MVRPQLISFDGGTTWYDAGSSSNLLYLTWDDPEQTTPIQTLLHVGCSAADGQSGDLGIDDHKILNKVWQKLQTKSVHRASDNFILTYYGFYDTNGNGSWDGDPPDKNRNDPDKCKVTAAEQLISSGNGQCLSWATFMNEVMRAQGLSRINGVLSNGVAVEIKKPSLAFAVKNWTKTGSTPRLIVNNDAGVDGSTPTSPNPASKEAADKIGVAGQGNSPNPPSNFRNHWITKMNGKYYDPSYGIGPYTDLKKYEDDAFDGRIGIDKMKVKLFDLPLDNADPADHADEICIYTPWLFP